MHGQNKSIVSRRQQSRHMSSDAPAASSSDKKPAKTLNINVGVLGHVDSGKTSLSRALSTVGSTAAFDKNPQSKERGITLDLGFSSFLRGLRGRTSG